MFRTWTVIGFRPEEQRLYEHDPTENIYLRTDTLVTLISSKGKLKEKRFKGIEMTRDQVKVIADLRGWVME